MSTIKSNKLQNNLWCHKTIENKLGACLKFDCQRIIRPFLIGFCILRRVKCNQIQSEELQ